MQWEEWTDGTMVARTDFAELHTWRVLSWSYGARLYTLDKRRILAQQGDLPSMEAARAWAEQEYARLLQAEVAAAI